MKILIDNSHGIDTKGKRSPDGRLLEYAQNRLLADRLATSLYNAAQVHLPGHRLRTDYTDADPDLEKDFYLLRHTLAPAVLVENLFMDNPADCAFLLSPEGQQALVDLHVDGIIRYLQGLSS